MKHGTPQLERAFFSIKPRIVAEREGFELSATL
jgi:hypothetical protein